MPAGKTLREFLREGPFALAMSSGFFGFFAHTGFLTVLEDEGLLPNRISGSSAGALVGASWAAGVDAPRLANSLLALERRDFWDPGVGAGLLRGALFGEKLASMMGRPTFSSTRVPVAVSGYHVRTRQTQVLASGDIGDAIRASCAVPVLFQPVWIEGRAYLDGGIRDRPGLHGMPRAEKRVLYHHIASTSPWRTSLAVPRRPGMVTLSIQNLPRSGPFKLDQGRLAYAAARKATQQVLDQPLEEQISIDAS